MVARNYTAQAINLAHDGSVTQSDVMVANAMVGDWAAQTTLGVGAEQQTGWLDMWQLACSVDVDWLVAMGFSVVGRLEYSKIFAEHDLC